MKYPTPDMFIDAEFSSKDITSSMNLVMKCIDQIFTENEVYPTKDTKKEDLIEFIDSLSSKQMSQLLTFFTTLPELKKEISITCAKCKEEVKITLRGIQDFFV